jgi:hypothetical protein
MFRSLQIVFKRRLGFDIVDINLMNKHPGKYAWLFFFTVASTHIHFERTSRSRLFKAISGRTSAGGFQQL